jgi:hypothetical protein
MTKKRGKKEKNEEKLKKKLQNDPFYCVFFAKVAHRIQKALSVLKLARFRGVEIAFSK